MSFLLSYLVPVLKVLYPIREPLRTRTVPLQILALGFSRSGTYSLRRALVQLGYTEVHHGFHVIHPDNVGETPQWVRLCIAQYRGQSDSLTAEDFDKCIGNCAAVTDQPSCVFAVELLRLYPDALVIVNRRHDDEAWHRSFMGTLKNLNAGFMDRMMSLFNTDLFWINMVIIMCMGRYFRFDVEKNALEVYREHYERIDKELDAQARQALRWAPDDGWGPLCEFLGHSPPNSPFPYGNDPKEFAVIQQRVIGQRQQQAKQNMKIFAGAVATIMTVGIAYVTSKK